MKIDFPIPDIGKSYSHRDVALQNIFLDIMSKATNTYTVPKTLLMGPVNEMSIKMVVLTYKIHLLQLPFIQQHNKAISSVAC